jgi:hypothetical protein
LALKDWIVRNEASDAAEVAQQFSHDGCKPIRARWLSPPDLSRRLFLSRRTNQHLSGDAEPVVQSPNHRNRQAAPAV